MTACLAAELTFGVWTSGMVPGQLIRVQRSEEHIRAEWTVPGEKRDPDGQPAGWEEIYGIQFLPGTWELRFYRRRESKGF